MSLRKGQKELVEQYRGGFCAVPAIPGGGKTHCLAVWTAEMISNGYHKPGKILIVTYMNSAVNNFKKRIAEELKNRGLDSKNDYFVTTIHGLCLQIVREKPDIASISDEFNVIDDIERNDLINRSVLEWRKKNQERFEFFIESSQLSSSKKAESLDNRWQNDFSTVILSAIGDFKCRGISPAEAIEKTHRLNSNSIIKCAAEIYALYDQKLKIAGYLDFNDMLYNAKKMLATDSLLLESYRKKFSFVCEDEAQDSNMIQSEILNLIANRNLLRVGDSNQAICGSFSSSDFTLFKDFCNTPQTRVFNITQSSRSSVQIINLANYFVDYVRNNHPVTRCRESLLMQHIEPVSPYDDRPNPVIDEKGLGSAIFRSWEEEAANIADFSRRMLQKHPDLSTAILIPTAWKMKLVAEILESKGIPFEQLDNSSAERNKALRKLGSIIGFAVKPDSSDRFALMLKECFFDSSYEIQENLTHKKNILEFIKKCPVEQLMYPSEDFTIPKEITDCAIWRKASYGFEKARQFLDFPISMMEKLILFAAQELQFGREDMAIACKIAGDVRYLTGPQYGWSMEDLANELLKPKSIFTFFAGTMWELKGYEPRPGIVTLSTYHKAKGLEWDTVFLTGLTYDDFPVNLEDRFKGESWYLKQEFRNPGALVKTELQMLLENKESGDAITESKIENISERARLLYVGITRAKRYLFLSGHHANPNRKNEIQPSRYLIELKKYIDSMEITRNTVK